VVGLAFGAGLAFAQVTGVVAIAAATLLGVAVALVATRLWLWAQVRSWPGPDRGPSLLWRVPEALCELHAESLRQHSANTSTLAGSALAGNLRTARLAFSPPVRHARSARLRPGRPVSVMVRRDLLGLRRQRSSLLAGAGFTVLGAAVFAWSLLAPAAPPVAAAVGLLPLYLGFGAWSEGLRLQADNIGTPSLLGIAARPEARAHLVIPILLAVPIVGGVHLLVAAGLGTGLGAGIDGRPERVAAQATAVVLVIALLAACHLLASFRGAPSMLRSPQMMIAWYALPGFIAVVVGAIICWAAHVAADGHTGALTASVWAVVLLFTWGFARVDRQTHLHRQ
jgi:hypothetical protein